MLKIEKVLFAGTDSPGVYGPAEEMAGHLAAFLMGDMESPATVACAAALPDGYMGLTVDGVIVLSSDLYDDCRKDLTAIHEEN